MKQEFEVGEEVTWTENGATVEILDILTYKKQIRYYFKFKNKEYWVPGNELEKIA
jgi:hypothetical protein